MYNGAFCDISGVGGVYHLCQLCVFVNSVCMYITNFCLYMWESMSEFINEELHLHSEIPYNNTLGSDLESSVSIRPPSLQPRLFPDVGC